MAKDIDYSKAIKSLGEGAVFQCNVRQKAEGSGLLVITESYVAFIADSSPEQIMVRIPHSRIESQKISPERVEKVQLQVILYGGKEKVTFHFAMERSEALKIRERVKDLLLQAMRKHKAAREEQERLQSQKAKVQPGDEEPTAPRPRDRRLSTQSAAGDDPVLIHKLHLLKNDPELLHLYQDLCSSGGGSRPVLTPEEFWAQHQDLLQDVQDQQSRNKGPGRQPGVLSTMFGGVDAESTLKGEMEMTPVQMNAIFQTYPLVREAYKRNVESVPPKLKPGQFWSKFFTSHLFADVNKKRSQTSLTGTISRTADDELADVFAKGIDGADIDYEGMMATKRQRLIDITGDDDYYTVDQAQAPEDRPQIDEQALAGDAVLQRKRLQNIRSYNQHSLRVLQACHVVSKELSSGNVSAKVVDKALRESNLLEDLEQEKEVAGKPLKIKDTAMYINESAGDIGKADQMAVDDGFSNEAAVAKLADSARACGWMLKEMEKWQKLDLSFRPNPDTAQEFLVSSTREAMEALKDPRGSFAKRVPGALQDQFRRQSSIVWELLSHFWRCFPYPKIPVPNLSDVDKLDRVMAALKQWEGRIVKRKDSTAAEKSIHEFAPIFDSLLLMIDQAKKQYDAYQAKTGRKAG